MVIINGRAADAAFARGFTKGLRDSGRPVGRGADGHWRPSVSLPPPFGKVEGDAAIQVLSTRAPEVSRYILIEREASAPGNERNILKWIPAWRVRLPITLRNGSQSFNIEPADAAVGLVFARAAGSEWSRSDFEKTAAFCKLLADSVNRVDGIRISVYVLPQQVASWEDAGVEAGMAFTELFVPD